jgi:hypothetical protein
MTFAFGSFTLGAALLFSAFKNMSLIDLVMGRPGESVASQGEHHPGSESGGGSGGVAVSGPATTDSKGLVTWHNPDGSTKQICKWIYFELKRVGWHGYIESGHRSESEQAATCATGVQPCATPGTSRHEGTSYPSCAIDVRQSEAAALSAKLKHAHSPLVYAGGKDPVHFSHPYGGSY